MAKQRPQETPAPRQAARAKTATAPAAAAQPSHDDAVALYEKGLDALQRHAYQDAVKALEAILERFPVERELHERVRLYLNVARRHVTSPSSNPKSVEERLYAATLATNLGRYDEAISHLRLVRDEDPDNDHALYMLSVALALKGEHAEAVAHLERAIAINPENRAMARQEADFETLRDDDAFRAATDAGNGAPRQVDGQRPPKDKTGR